MKKLFLAVFVSMMMWSPVHAGEEIQLAAVMTESGSDNLTTHKKLYAIGDARSGGVFHPGTKDSDFDYAIIGAIAVGALVFIAADGVDSTTNH